MMAKHHGDDGSTGAALPAGCGGLFLLLILVGLVVKYWWVIALVLGAAIMVRAIWVTYCTPEPDSGRSVPRVARAGQPGVPGPGRKLPAKAQKPKKSPAPSGDALTAQLRSDKRRRRRLAMEEWDGEWERLLGPGPERQPVRTTGSRRRQPATTSSSIAIGTAVVVVKRIPANAEYPAQAELGDTGAVAHVGAPSQVPGLRPIMVRLDRTGQVVTILEKNLVPSQRGSNDG